MGTMPGVLFGHTLIPNWWGIKSVTYWEGINKRKSLTLLPRVKLTSSVKVLFIVYFYTI